MAINSLDSVRTSLNVKYEQAQRTSTDQKKTETEQIHRRDDTLEISTEARKIQGNQLSERLQQVQQQVSAGFYNNPDVIRQAAAKIAESFRTQDNENVDSVTT
ncbi:MAG: hypothetical protein JST20_14450 [Bacteroidetes bacterium]|nr:hypothetical protein [Bacteroidota bacterium]